MEDGLLDVLQEVQDTLGDPLFQQDNARIHTAADTMAWFEENNVEVMEWPACSPDLNPIEHCWQRLKDKMHQHYPDIAMTPGGPAKVRAHLERYYPRFGERKLLGNFWRAYGNRCLRGWLLSLRRRADIPSTDCNHFKFFLKSPTYILNLCT